MIPLAVVWSSSVFHFIMSDDRERNRLKIEPWTGKTAIIKHALFNHYEEDNILNYVFRKVKETNMKKLQSDHTIRNANEHDR